MNLEERLEEAIIRRRTAEQFSDEWFVARNEVETLSNELYLQEQKANHAPAPTAEQLAVMEWALSEEYDE